MKKITIAIDGFSSTGKSTIAKQLAKKLNYVYVDTGAMYRAVALFVLNNGLINEAGEVKNLVEKLPEITLNFKLNEETGNADTYLNGENVEKEIRTLRVSNVVSMVAAISEVRKKLVEQQKKMGAEKGVVMDGRDIGTVVFPDAELKLFMTASAKTRAHRRYKELVDRGEEVTFDAVLKNVQERDHLDSNREDSPLIQAETAIEFDNSDMGLKEQFERIYNFALRIIEKQ
ncbi:cytidylate kinase [Galbibacter orientalis DSM 19592]|uniref:Cytidylate kinase n=1 Tax=Galbibacter orientalis DSM 19592 TaxID=926559 RepID=I3CA10_9FLAO|nr:(d)CMP kinase [Galbibacter orientalis]EIJ40453.1 cytidylate kinase [Galbibacter orientalis DSM 19592]